MRIAVPHNTTKAKARQIVESRLKDAHSQYGNHISELDHQWDGDVLSVKLKAKGISAKGTLQVTDSDIIIDGKLPLIAMPFESRIRSTVEKEAEAMFAGAKKA